MPKTSTPVTEPEEDEPTDGQSAATSGDDAAAGTEAPTSEPSANTSRTPASESRFFAWLRGIDLPRETGWIGGVCAGVARRLGIDPLIVRGIAVVLAVLGAPVILVYAAAWLLLPDRAGQIHLQELLRGHVTPAFPAIVGLALLSFLPWGQGFWYLGGLYWGVPDVTGAVVRALWAAVVVAAIIVLVVWLARRASGDVPTTPATTDDRPETIPAAPAAARAEPVVTETLPGEPPAPPAPPAGASDADLAAWKQSQAEWQAQRGLWIAEQQRSEQERRQAEKQARAEEWARAAAERQRIRRLTRPRAGGAVHAAVFGLALLVGAVGAFVAAGRPDTADFAWAIGVALGTTVVGLSAIVVGLARRRSGFLAFLGIVGVIATLLTLIVPVDRRVLPVGANYTLSSTQSAQFAQLAGHTTFWVEDRNPSSVPVVDLWQGTGTVEVQLDEDARVRLEYVTADAAAPVVTLMQVDQGDAASAELQQTGETAEGHARYTASIGNGSVDLVIRVWLGTGALYVTTYAEAERPVLEISPPPVRVQEFPGETYSPFAKQ